MAQDHNNEDNDEYQQFLADNLDQLNSLGIPELFWKTLQRKISSESFDGGNKFMLTHVAEDDSGIPVDSNYKVVVCDEEGLKHDDPKQIYLIDHACTWRSQEELRYYLDNMEGLKERLAGILNVSTTDYDCATEICKRSYNRSGTYSYPSEQPFDVWYLNDELGARVRHSSSPSVQSGVFRCAQMGGALTVMWLLRDIRYGEEVTRDFVRPGTTPIKREVILCAYGLESSLPEELPVVSNLKPRPWYQEWARIIGETTTAVEENDAERVQRESSGRLAIYSDIKSLVEAESNIFTIVSEPEDADVIWQADHWKNFDELRPDQLISQFPNEHLLTTKVCLSEVAKRLRQGNRQHPNWFSQSFDLKSEIETFVAQYNKNEANDAENTWILKAWNFAHGTSALISRDLLELVRHHECSIPYLVQKYIERPILLPNNDALKVKFDFRYHVVVKSFKPLKAAIVKRFWPKFAARPYDSDSFTDLQAHLTNIAISEERVQPWFTDFIKLFEDDTGYDWEQDVQNPTSRAIKECLTAAASCEFSAGKIKQLQNSRALYGVDIMLEESDNGIAPKILEFNFNCDCSRVAQIVPDFYDEMIDFIYRDNWDRLPHIDISD